MGLPIAPSVSAQSFNPMVVSIDRDAIDDVASTWAKPSPIMPLIKEFQQPAIVQQIPIIGAPAPMRQVSNGAPHQKNNLTVRTVTAVRRSYEIEYAISLREKNGSEVYARGFDQVVATMQSPYFREQTLAIQAMDALVANPVRTYDDGKAFFATDHPVDVFNPARTKRAGGSATTQSNLLTSKALSMVNLQSAISTLLTLSTDSGIVIPIKKIYLCVAQTNYALAMQLVHGSLTGFSSTFGSSDSAGSHSNPIHAIGIPIEVILLDQYAGTATDWYLVTDNMPLFRVGFNPENYFVYYHVTAQDAIYQGEDKHIVTADFSISLAAQWQTAIKCTA